VSSAVVGQTVPGYAGPNAPTEPPEPPIATSQAGVQPGGNASQSIWDQDTLTGDWGGVRRQLLDKGVTFGLQEQSEVWGNMAGGLKQGTVYDGLTTASVGIDLEKLAGWDSLTFFVSGYQIHGGRPSGDLVGNNQLVSNIEATADTKLYALWLEQKLLSGRLTVRLGQEGANDQMMITRYGALFLNSSFGFPGLLAADLPSGGPNYPIAAPFVRAQYQANNEITLVAALFSGDPAPSGQGDPQLRDKGGVAFRLNDHVLAFGEFWYAINQSDDASGLPGTYKLGAWYASASFADQVFDTAGIPLASPASNGVARSHSGGYALYGIVDQLVWQKPGTKGQGVGVFLQIMGAPAGYNLSNLFIEGGMNWIGPFKGRDNDTFGLGVSYLGISPAARRHGNDLVFYNGSGFPYAGNETVLELTYNYQAAPWLSVQPDFQAIFNPNAGIPSASSQVPLKNDVIAGIRAKITF
jgi:porin